jgi:hypothetical protein
MVPMPHVELTDRPCPDCGQLLEIRVQVAERPIDPQSTVQVARLLICPECGYQKEIKS